MPLNRFAAIAATCGWTEYEVQEDGVFLQPEEAEAVNTALTNGTAAAADLVTANASVQQLTKQNEDWAAADTTSQETIRTQATRITELEAEVKTLGGKSSGTGTKLDAKEDETTEKPARVSLLSADHPLNIAAAKEIARKKK